MDKHLKKAAYNNRLWKFILLAYTLTWIFWVPMSVISRGLIDAKVPLLLLNGLGVIGPSLATIIMVAFSRGKYGVWNLIKKLLEWRVHFGWYIYALTMRLVILIVVYCLFFLTSRITVNFAKIDLIKIIMLFLYYTVCALGEEIGWRGFALPKLQEKFNPLVSSLILGVVWSCWHLPLFFTQGGEHINKPFGYYMLNMIAFTIIITILYNRTKGSILLATLFHGGFNIALDIIPNYSYTLLGISTIYIITLIIVLLNRNDLFDRTKGLTAELFQY